MTPDSVLRSFVVFLDGAWKAVGNLTDVADQGNDLIGDWLQANFEILVEAVLFSGNSKFLEVYGDGADCNGASSRVFRPEAQPTHRILCLPSGTSELRDLVSGRSVDSAGSSFWGFVSWDGEIYSTRPKFNAVLLEGNGIVVLDLDKVRFDLEEIK